MAAEVKTEKEAEVTEDQPNTSNLCCYSQRVCTLDKLKGFDFCHMHILEDKASPFKPCDFLAKSNGKRCNNPAPKMHDKEKSYCIIHTRKAELRRAVEQRRKRRQRHMQYTQEEEEDLENEIEEVLAPPKRRRWSSSKSNEGQHSRDDDDEDGDDQNSSDEDATIDLEVGGALKVDSAWHGDVDSDAESVDSEEEDVLRHAGVWTVDEVTRTCCDKMVRLKTLYVGQYKRLMHVLQEKRRKYYQTIQAEEEEEIGECDLSPAEILGPLGGHRRHGVEALLHKQAKEKKLGVSPRHQTMAHLRCTHSAEGVRCSDRVLPLTKHCIKHIGHDPQQLLFESCSFLSGDDKPCGNIVPNIYTHTACRLHHTLPDQPIRSDLQTDFRDAQERDRLRKEREKEMNDAELQADLQGIQPVVPDASATLMSTRIGEQELPIPKALQEKSSALLPPPQPGLQPSISEAVPPPPPQSRATAASNDHLSSEKESGVEKMDINLMPSEILDLAGARSSESTPQEVSSPASVDSSPAGIQNISPTLLVASLVAVCSGAGISSAIPSVTSTVMSSAADSSAVSATGALSTFTVTAVSTSSSTVMRVACGSASEMLTSRHLVPTSSPTTESAIKSAVGIPATTESSTTFSTSAPDVGVTSLANTSSAASTATAPVVAPSASSDSSIDATLAAVGTVAAGRTSILSAVTSNSQASTYSSASSETAKAAVTLSARTTPLEGSVSTLQPSSDGAASLESEASVILGRTANFQETLGSETPGTYLLQCSVGAGAKAMEQGVNAACIQDDECQDKEIANTLKDMNES